MPELCKGADFKKLPSNRLGRYFPACGSVKENSCQEGPWTPRPFAGKVTWPWKRASTSTLSFLVVEQASFFRKDKEKNDFQPGLIQSQRKLSQVSHPPSKQKGTSKGQTRFAFFSFYFLILVDKSFFVFFSFLFFCWILSVVHFQPVSDRAAPSHDVRNPQRPRPRRPRPSCLPWGGRRQSARQLLFLFYFVKIK